MQYRALDAAYVVCITILEKSSAKPIFPPSFAIFKLRVKTYSVMLEKVAHYLTENGIQNVGVKTSAANQKGMSLFHLTSAELRGSN
jgi:hypothetical protein